MIVVFWELSSYFPVLLHWEEFRRLLHNAAFKKQEKEFYILVHSNLTKIYFCLTCWLKLKHLTIRSVFYHIEYLDFRQEKKIFISLCLDVLNVRCLMTEECYPTRVICRITFLWYKISGTLSGRLLLLRTILFTNVMFYCNMQKHVTSPISISQWSKSYKGKFLVSRV